MIASDAGVPGEQRNDEQWRVGRHFPIHVYRGDVPVATFHTVADAAAAVEAHNARLDGSGSETPHHPQRPKKETG